eukprot:RCo044047
MCGGLRGTFCGSPSWKSMTMLMMRHPHTHDCPTMDPGMGMLLFGVPGGGVAVCRASACPFIGWLINHWSDDGLTFAAVVRSATGMLSSDISQFSCGLLAYPPTWGYKCHVLL